MSDRDDGITLSTALSIMAFFAITMCVIAVILPRKKPMSDAELDAHYAHHQRVFVVVNINPQDGEPWKRRPASVYSTREKALKDFPDTKRWAIFEEIVDE